ncbi:MAG: polysaccharide pyruvyl transferase family protein [Acidobacteriota bacterium]|nr:polysaccharide pyruvyl transferase family protein [Acidobacteriota bacterium]
MLIQVIGTNSWNKGAELMLYAIAAQRQSTLQNHSLAVQYGRTSPETVARLGLTQLPSGIRSVVARASRLGRGFVSESRVEAVLDASGFAYSDQWGARPSMSSAALLQKRRRNGCKIVLMPQAFGPFEDSTVRNAFASVAATADLIYARDRRSHQHLIHAGCEPSTIRMAPDFTLALDAGTNSDSLETTGRVLIVPNVRMLDKTTSASAYVEFLARVTEHLHARGAEPLFVLHTAAEDRVVVTRVQENLLRSVTTIVEPDVLRLKRLLGAARLVLSSRYHAIIGSLSAGVPCIATGWSHKYDELYADYHAPDLLMHDLSDFNTGRALIDLLLDDPLPLRNALLQRTAEMRLQVSAMWSEIGELLGRS